MIEIGIGLIVLGLLIYTIGVFLFLDRAMLAIGNVTKLKINNEFIDLLLNGSGGSRRSQERSWVLHQIFKNTRFYLFLCRFLNYHDRLVDVHIDRLPVLDVGYIPLIPVFPRHHHDLRSVPPYNRGLPKDRRCQECCEIN